MNRAEQQNALREILGSNGYDLPKRPELPSIEDAEAIVQGLLAAVVELAKSLGIHVDAQGHRDLFPARSLNRVHVEILRLDNALLQAATFLGIDVELLSNVDPVRRPLLIEKPESPLTDENLH